MGSSEDKLVLSLVYFRHRSDLGLPRTSGYALLPSPNVGECTNHAGYLYSGRIWLSPPSVYPSNTVELEAKKGNLGPDATLMPSTNTLELARVFPSLLGALFKSIRC